MTVVVLDSELVPLTSRVPALIVVAPVYLLVAVSVQVPVPLFVSPPGPGMIWSICPSPTPVRVSKPVVVLAQEV